MYPVKNKFGEWIFENYKIKFAMDISFSADGIYNDSDSDIYEDVWVSVRHFGCGGWEEIPCTKWVQVSKPGGLGYNLRCTWEKYI